MSSSRSSTRGDDAGSLIVYGSSTKIATIIISKSQFTFQLSAEAKAGALRLLELKRATRRAYRSLAVWRRPACSPHLRRRAIRGSMLSGSGLI